MNRFAGIRDLSYEAKARLADNLYVWRRRRGYSQERLGERALVSPGQICRLENAASIPRLDSYVRLSGALSVSLDDLLAGVRWTSGLIELGEDPCYRVEFEAE